MQSLFKGKRIAISINGAGAIGYLQAIDELQPKLKVDDGFSIKCKTTNFF